MSSPPLFPPSDLDPALKKLWRHYFVIYRGLSLLPSMLAYRLTDWLGIRRLQRERTVAEGMMHGMRSAMPEITPESARLNVASFYRMAAREVLDVFVLPQLRPHDIGRTLIPIGFENLRAERGRGTIIAMAHFGRPIMLSTALGLSGFEIGMLSQPVDHRNPHLNAVDRAYLTLKIANTVAQAKGRWLTTLDNPRFLYKALERGETIIIMLDVISPEARPAYQANFFGGTLSIPTGILRLMEKTGARLVYAAAIDQGMTVRAEIRALDAATPGAAMQAAVTELEMDARAHPEQWWQWGALHHVWKPAK